MHPIVYFHISLPEGTTVPSGFLRYMLLKMDRKERNERKMLIVACECGIMLLNCGFIGFDLLTV